jgi:hypothetical protein
MSRGNYRMLETPPDEPIVEIQRVEHESRVHIDIETDDIPAEVARLEKLGARVASQRERWVVMEAPTGQRFCVVRVQRPGRWSPRSVSFSNGGRVLGRTPTYGRPRALRRRRVPQAYGQKLASASTSAWGCSLRFHHLRRASPAT